MRVTQAAQVLNNVINKQQYGDIAVVAEDLSNIVDVGKQTFQYWDSLGNKTDLFDRFTTDLIDQVGRIDFVNRPYRSQAPDIMKNGWEYGAILEKVRCELQDARDNASWQLPEYYGNSAYPDPFELSPPNVSASFFQGKTTYEVPITLTEKQLREAFRGPSEMSRFLSMIENRIAVKRTLCNDGLIMGTICNLIGTKLYKGHYIDLLALYNNGPNYGGTPLTAAKAKTDADFLRFASMVMGQYTNYLEGASVLYNEGDYITYTPKDELKFVMLADWSKAFDSYLYSGTFHDDYVKLKGFEEVSYWQGTGKTENERGKVLVTIAGEEEGELGYADNVVAVMFDTEAAAVCNQDDRVTSIYNPRGEYTNYFYKWDALYMNDVLENCVVFTVGSFATGGFDLTKSFGETLPTGANKTAWNGYCSDTSYNSGSAYFYLKGGTLKQLTGSDAIPENPGASFWTKYANCTVYKVNA